MLRSWLKIVEHFLLGIAVTLFSYVSLYASDPIITGLASQGANVVVKDPHVFPWAILIGTLLALIKGIEVHMEVKSVGGVRELDGHISYNKPK